MDWLPLVIVIIFYIAYTMWRSYFHPSHVLGRQAANMNWVAIGRVPSNDGYKNLKLTRDGMVAIISFKNGNVELIEPSHETPFKDFIELERWIATEAQDSINDEEGMYYNSVNDFMKLHGYYEPFLELQVTDKEFFIASMKVLEAAYLSGQSEKVIGALIMDSVKNYEQNRELAIVFLQKLKERYHGGHKDEADTVALNEDNNSYHLAFDKASDEAFEFVQDNKIYVWSLDNRLGVSCDFLVYAACCLAMEKSGIKISTIGWNTFKRSIEFKILGPDWEPSSLNKTIVTPEGTTFVHNSSHVFDELTRLQDFVLDCRSKTGALDLQPLVTYILAMFRLDGNREHEYLLQNYLIKVADFASREIVPKVARVYG